MSTAAEIPARDPSWSGQSPWFFVPLAMIALPLASCRPSDPGRVPLFAAGGRVLCDDKPAAGVELRFYPDPPRPDGLTPLARSRPDGTFDVTTYEEEDGVPPGRYSVGLRWPESDSKVRSGPKPDRLKERYRDPAKTSWRVEITPGVNDLGEIAVRSEPRPASLGKVITRGKASRQHDGPLSHGTAKAGGP